MEGISIDSLDSGGVKGNYVELSPLVFEGMFLKPNRDFTFLGSPFICLCLEEFLNKDIPKMTA